MKRIISNARAIGRVYLPRTVTKVNHPLGPRLVLETFRRPLRYCSGVTVPSQVVIAVRLKRITPSSKEQK